MKEFEKRRNEDGQKITQNMVASTLSFIAYTKFKGLIDVFVGIRMFFHVLIFFVLLKC